MIDKYKRGTFHCMLLQDNYKEGQWLLNSKYELKVFFYEQDMLKVSTIWVKNWNTKQHKKNLLVDFFIIY